MTKFTWADGSEIDFDGLPETSKAAIISRGIGHITGNEAASHVVGRIRQHLAGSDRKAESVTGDEVKAFREGNPEFVSQLVSAFHADKLAAIVDGTLGVRASGGGQAVDPLQRQINTIATEEVTALLAKHGLKMPTKDGTVKVRGVDCDRAELVRRHLAATDRSAKDGAPNSVRIEKLAKAALDAKVKRLKTVAEGEGDLADALGM